MRWAAPALMLMLVVVAAGGCGADDELGSGDLMWEKKPRVFTNPNLPDDRILAGTVRNDSLETVNLVARDLGVRTFPQNRGSEIPESEQLRIGLRARLKPGETAPLTVSWRQQGEHASVVDYGAGTLPVPGG